jgi:Tfp pilus assembly protein PilN
MMRRIDLLPPVYAEQRKQRRQVALVVVAGVAVFALLVVFWVGLGAQISDKEDELAVVEARNAAIQAKIAELQRFENLETELAAKRDALRTVMTGDVDWPSLLTEIAMVVPGEVWLDTLTASAAQTEGEAPVGTETAEIRVSDQVPFGRVQFTGNSLDMPGIAKWLIRLASVREFSAVWLNSATESETQTEETVINFDSTLELSTRAASDRFQGGNE